MQASPDINATLIAHTCLISALIVSHPDRAQVLRHFGFLMSQQIEHHAADPQFSGVLQTLEDYFRTIILPPTS
jgi:hypothetical protein